MAVRIEVINEECIDCDLCMEMCPATPCVFEIVEGKVVAVNPEACEECGLCVEHCPTNAIRYAQDEDTL